MLDCDAVIFLPGYKRSRGCTIEFELARLLEMPIYTFDQTGALVLVKPPNKDTDVPDWFKVFMKILGYAVVTGVCIGISLAVLMLIAKLVLVIYGWLF